MGVLGGAKAAGAECAAGGKHNFRSALQTSHTPDGSGREQLLKLWHVVNGSRKFLGIRNACSGLMGRQTEAESRSEDTAARRKLPE